jgi:carboxylate-amine ligase
MSQVEFRGNDWPTLGVEVELQLVDSETMALRSAIGEVLAGMPEGLDGAVKPEFLQCYVEINSGVGRRVDEIEADLAPKLRAVERAAEQCGTRLFWGATHPFSRWRDQEITPNARYYELADLLQETVRRPVTFGLHVHVGVGSGDAAVAVTNRLMEHLPTLLALSANSPFWHGRPTGLHAHRIELLEGFPTGGLPPLMRDWGDYTTLVDRLAGCGFIKSTKEIWWDVRPNADSGTLEVRICDMPPDFPSTLALTALIQCLVHDLAREADSGLASHDEHQALMVRQNRWRACRFGLGAELVDPSIGEARTAREVARHLVDHLAPTAEALGCVRHLDRVAALADAPTGAERQLDLFRRTGDLAEVVRRLSEASALGPSPTGAAECNGVIGLEMVAV